MGAMVLATPLFLSSCSSSDDIADNPGNTTGEAVKTSFTLSVGLPGGSSSNAKPSTRMSDTEVQSTVTSAVSTTSTSFRLPRHRQLPVQMFVSVVTSHCASSATNGQNNVYESSAAKGTDHATVYANVSVPVGTLHSSSMVRLSTTQLLRQSHQMLTSISSVR